MPHGWPQQIAELTAIARGATASEPWAVTDAPERFIEAQIKGIVGLEIEIAEIHGKWKVSQNRPVVDRRGVAEGLDATDGASSEEMAELVRHYGGLGSD